MDNEERIPNVLPDGVPSEEEPSLVLSDSDQEHSMSEPEGTATAPETRSDEAKDLTKNSKTPNKMASFLKSKLGICIIVAILILGVISVVFIKKYNNEKEYEKNLKEFVIESGKASMASAYICDDLRKVWQEYIFDDKEYFKRSTGTFTSYSYNGDEYCSDFSEAVNRKIRWNNEHLSSELTEPFRSAKRLYKEMTPPPGKYKEIHIYVKQMFKAMERLHELSENPKGNLSSYSSDCNDAVNDYTSALSDLSNECDIDFSNIEDV